MTDAKTAWENNGMVKPTKARALAAIRSTRKLRYGLGIGGVLWEGVNRLGEHILLSWIAERLQEEVGLVDFLKWTVEHPGWFFVILGVVYLATVSLKAMFGRDEDQGGDYGPGGGPNINQERSKGAQAGAVGSIGDIDRSNVNIGGTQNFGPVTYHQSGIPASPQLSITKWIPIPENHALAGRGQTGFEIVNDGGVAYDILH